MPGTKNKLRYKIVSVSLTGPYHKQKGLRCQDFAKTKIQNRRIVAVAADGAGSAKYGAIGAKCVCDIICRTLISKSMKNMRQSVIDAINAARDNLICHRLNKTKSEASLIDFASTIVGAVYDGKDGLFFHIGDGAGIALGLEKDKKIVLSEPENGIFSSETFFFTMEDWKDSLRFTPFDKAKSFILMTDGVTCFALKHDKAYLEDGFIAPIDAFLKAEKSTKRAQKALKNTLETPKACRLSGDDKTFVWVGIQ